MKSATTSSGRKRKASEARSIANVSESPGATGVEAKKQRQAALVTPPNLPIAAVASALGASISTMARGLNQATARMEQASRRSIDMMSKLEKLMVSGLLGSVSLSVDGARTEKMENTPHWTEGRRARVHRYFNFAEEGTIFNGKNAKPLEFDGPEFLHKDAARAIHEMCTSSFDCESAWWCGLLPVVVENTSAFPLRCRSLKVSSRLTREGEKCLQSTEDTELGKFLLKPGVSVSMLARIPFCFGEGEGEDDDALRALKGEGGESFRISSIALEFESPFPSADAMSSGPSSTSSSALSSSSLNNVRLIRKVLDFSTNEEHLRLFYKLLKKTS